MQTVIRIIEDSGTNFDMKFENFVINEEFKVLTSGFHLAVLTHSSGTNIRSSADAPPVNR